MSTTGQAEVICSGEKDITQLPKTKKRARTLNNDCFTQVVTIIMFITSHTIDNA